MNSTPVVRSRVIHVIRDKKACLPRPVLWIGKSTHILELLRRILQTVGVALEDARRGDARIQPAFPVPDRLAQLPHPLLVTHVRAEVLETALASEAIEPLGVVPDLGPFLAGLLREVHAVDRACAGLDERQRHREPEAAVPGLDQGDTVG